MNYWHRRRLGKHYKQVMHDARHARHMREDIADPETLEALREAEQTARTAWKQHDYPAVAASLEPLMQRARAVYPVKAQARLREYVEIAVVAVSVAMAFRTFFVQPFKIPTGSMEPTLFGITVQPQVGRGALDRFPLNLASLALFGDRYVEVRAARSGVVEQLVRDETYVFSLNGVVPPFRPGMAQHFEIGDAVQQGQLLASGRVRAGDHIFVNRMRYNFSPPRRGDVFVFSTDGVTHPQVKQDTYYIKRLVALPGEEVSIDPPYLHINGQRLVEPWVFHRQVYARDQGYHGYVLPPTSPQIPTPPFIHPRSVLRLGPTEFLPLGDNTRQSLDGRYFGGIDRQNVVGPAVMVYWPLSRRWGWIR